VDAATVCWSFAGYLALTLAFVAALFALAFGLARIFSLAIVLGIFYKKKEGASKAIGSWDIVL